MNKIQELIFIHAWLLAYGLIIFGTLRGNLSEQNYNARMNPFWRDFLMPGAWKNKQNYIKWERTCVLLTLPFVALIYGSVLYKILWKS